MAYDGWFQYGDVELANVARTSLLAASIGLSTVRIRKDIVDWLEKDLTGTSSKSPGYGLGEFGLTEFGGYDDSFTDITKAPWYDPDYPASAEFAGLIPLSMQGLDDSTLESTTIEYVGDGGHAGKPRNGTLTIVANFAIVALSERGAEFGKRWMDRVLRSGGGGTTVFCSGTDLIYFRFAGTDAPLVHRRDVRQTRGSSVTRKKNGRCSATWLVTFTLTAADPYEYGDGIQKITSLGDTTATGPGVTSFGTLSLTETGCPVYDYTPIYDPLYPALVASPTAPNLLPDGWGIAYGEAFTRHWTRISPVEPNYLSTVPVLKIDTTVEARMVRVSVFPSSAATDAQCGAMFTAILFYLPANTSFYIDGEQKASYVWDGFSPSVRRTDSLVYGLDANPIDWSSFNDPSNLLVTLDTFTTPNTPSGVEGDGQVRVGLSLVPKSD